MSRVAEKWVKEKVCQHVKTLENKETSEEEYEEYDKIKKGRRYASSTEMKKNESYWLIK